MLFKNTVALAIMSVIMKTMQSPAGPLICKTDEELIVINIKSVGNQILYWYSYAKDSVHSVSLIKKTCGNNMV